MQSLSSIPSFLQERPPSIVERLGRVRNAVVRRRSPRSARSLSLDGAGLPRDGLATAPHPSWVAKASSLLRAYGVSARVSSSVEELSCPRSERAWFAAAIVSAYALVAVLGLSPAAAPLVLGGVGVALMVAWIGWYWPDEA